MKISCQSCEAKYTIADEKVRGKVVKIRCKKCGTAIVVKGTEPPAAGAAQAAAADYDDAPTRVLDRDELSSALGSGGWTVNVSEGDQRVVATGELVELYRSGVVDDGTFVWRDGMEDWKPIGEIPELTGMLPRRSQPAAPPKTPPQTRAAVRESRASSTDIFGASALAGRDPALGGRHSADTTPMTGARNESSVLFSLDALTSGSPARSGSSTNESSSIVDLKTLMAASETAPTPPAKSKVEDLMNLGTGGGIFASTLGAPDITAPPPEEPAAAAAAPSTQSRSNKGLLFGGIGAVVVALGVGAALLLGNKKEEPQPLENSTVASTAPVASAEPPPVALAPVEPAPAEAKPSAEQAAEPAKVAEAASSEVNDSAKEPEKPKDVAPAVAQASDQRAKNATPTTAPAKTPAKSETKTASSSPASKATATAPAPAKGEAPPFDRAAALAALNAAADAARACKKPDGPTGSGRVAVTFAPSGVVTAVNIEGPPFAGTAVGGCVAARFRNARVPAFSGGIVTVRKSFTIN